MIVAMRVQPAVPADKEALDASCSGYRRATCAIPGHECQKGDEVPLVHGMVKKRDIPFRFDLLGMDGVRLVGSSASRRQGHAPAGIRAFAPTRSRCRTPGRRRKRLRPGSRPSCGSPLQSPESSSVTDTRSAPRPMAQQRDVRQAGRLRGGGLVAPTGHTRQIALGQPPLSRRPRMTSPG